MRKRKEPTITIKDIATNCDLEVGVSLYYKICCRKLVFKYFSIYRNVFSSQGIELNDLKQDILLMIWEILKENKKTKKIPSSKIGGYLYNATRRQLNNIVSKANTTYKRTVSLNVCNIDNIPQEEVNENKSQSDIFSDILEKDKDSLLKLTKRLCTEKEAMAIIKYYFRKKNIVVIADEMQITKQRVSALMKQAILKLKNNCTEQITKSKELE